MSQMVPQQVESPPVNALLEVPDNYGVSIERILQLSHVYSARSFCDHQT